MNESHSINRGNWEAVRFIATHGIKEYIEGGIRYEFFSNRKEGVGAIDELIQWLSEQDEFEWCKAMLDAKKTYITVERINDEED